MILKDAKGMLTCSLGFMEIQDALGTYNKTLSIFSIRLQQTNFSSTLKCALFAHTVNHMISFLGKVLFHDEGKDCLKLKPNIQACIDEFRKLYDFTNILKDQFSSLDTQEKYDLLVKLTITQKLIDKYIREFRLSIPINPSPEPMPPPVPPDYHEIHKKLPKESCCKRLFNAIFN